MRAFARARRAFDPCCDLATQDSLGTEDPKGRVVVMSTEDNKNLIRQYIKAVDDNQSSDWSVS